MFTPSQFQPLRYKIILKKINFEFPFTRACLVFFLPQFFSSKLKQRVSENIDELWEELESFGVTGSSTGNLEDFEDEVSNVMKIVSETISCLKL